MSHTEQTTHQTNHHTGSCLCGGVAFEISGTFEHFFLCHCQRCRKASGTAHTANLFSTTASVVWLSGEDLLCHYHVPESRHARCFCKICGSALPLAKPELGLVLVPAGCLDTPLAMRAEAHIFTGSRAEWDDDLAALPQFEALPG
ncbi:GFA family protein [uncultured Cohaesibacter sp.]|uniref:GFA family protein n=1 Tax=uncultured Cohaesibacter sp. TaxID=1002546 RepID=UPI0029C8EB90|nr:GFA family protein [uncultured Cohaesibacter sp.]